MSQTGKESLYLSRLVQELSHVHIHNHWLRQGAQAGKIEVVYTPSAELMADGLTKALTREKFEILLRLWD